MSSPPPSSLSSFSSMDSPPPHHHLHHPATPPIKRAASASFSDHDHEHEASSPILTHHQHHHQHSHPANFSDISSDTSGSVPGTPLEADEFEHAEQVTVCRWDGCNKDLGNMDDLVKHIHDEHIGARRAKYACEWDDCNRKGMPHASGYALRAHMRSHTKEKPFYCTLPECDRSFTRSDALAKHMRTVHETEALRPSDPIPKSHPNHPQNLHLPNRSVVPHSPSSTSPSSPSSSAVKPSLVGGGNGTSRWYAPEDGFEPDEESRTPKELVKLLKRKLVWAEQQQGELKKSLDDLERKREEGWVKKEMLLDRVIIEELGKEEASELSLDSVME